MTNVDCLTQISAIQTCFTRLLMAPPWTEQNSTVPHLGGVTLDETIFSEANLDQADFTDAVIENMDGTWFQHAINLPIHLQQML
jgi:uncharacterized protein YjbI with pentapeptide repeats